jgi:hypothetical protein
MGHPGWMRVLVLACAASACSGAMAQMSSKARLLPASATEATSIVSNVPDFMVLMDEGGKVPGDPKAACDNRAHPGVAGLHLEHYFAGAGPTFEQKVGILRQHMGLKQAALGEAGAATVVMETLDGAEVAYFVVTLVCPNDPSALERSVNARDVKVHYLTRLIKGTTYADIRVEMQAPNPDAARKFTREILQKIGTIDFSSVK